MIFNTENAKKIFDTWVVKGDAGSSEKHIINFFDRRQVNMLLLGYSDMLLLSNKFFFNRDMFLSINFFLNLCVPVLTGCQIAPFGAPASDLRPPELTPDEYIMS